MRTVISGKTALTVPAVTGGFLSEAYAREVKPLERTYFVITGNHIPVRHVVTEAECRLKLRAIQLLLLAFLIYLNSAGS